MERDHIADHLAVARRLAQRAGDELLVYLIDLAADHNQATTSPAPHADRPSLSGAPGAAGSG